MRCCPAWFLEASGGSIFLFQLLEASCIPPPLALLYSKHITPTSSYVVTSFSYCDPPATLYKDPCAFMGPTWATQDHVLHVKTLNVPQAAQLESGDPWSGVTQVAHFLKPL